MGNGEFAYGHGQQIFLEGKELSEAEKAKRVREETCAATKLPEILDRALHYKKKRICPACLAISGDSKKTCRHVHPEDEEIFEVATLPIELRVVRRGSTIREYNRKQKEKEGKS